MIVGHHPRMHDLALELTGDGDEVAILTASHQVPDWSAGNTAAGRASWDELTAGQAYLADLVLPRPPQ